MVVPFARFRKKDIEDNSARARVRRAIDDLRERVATPRPRAQLANRRLVDDDDDRVRRGAPRQHAQRGVARGQLQNVGDAERDQQCDDDRRDRRDRERWAHAIFASWSRSLSRVRGLSYNSSNKGSYQRRNLSISTVHSFDAASSFINL